MKKKLILSILIVGILATGSVSALTIEVSTVKLTTMSTLPLGQLGGGCGGGGCHGGGGGCHNNTNLTEITGVLLLDGTTFSIDSTILMFGCYTYLNTTVSPYDFDGDGVTETIWNELVGMVGTSITVEGFMCCQNTRLVVYYINGIEYREGCPGNFTKVCIH